MAKTRDIPEPNAYILAMRADFAPWTYDEESAPSLRGRWRSAAFEVAPEKAVDLEIGTGNGLHFAHRALTCPDRCLIGLELKYKPLIQSIRRVRREFGCNARVARYNAYLVHELFEPGELNDVFIFFPDPWEKTRQHKHRLIQDEFLVRLHGIQRPGSRLIFKTDSQDYFRWAMERFARSPYKVKAHTFDLHASEHVAGNFMTQFERIFVRQGLAIGWAHLEV